LASAVLVLLRQGLPGCRLGRGRFIALLLVLLLATVLLPVVLLVVAGVQQGDQRCIMSAATARKKNAKP
jgi:hypothetical protein